MGLSQVTWIWKVSKESFKIIHLSQPFVSSKYLDFEVSRGNQKFLNPYLVQGFSCGKWRKIKFLEN